MSERIINVGIVAHADAGKTTLTEQLLYLCGQVKQPGRVDDGTTQTDTLAFERRRGVSARAAAVTLEQGDLRINLIDTPGHVDFISEVERSLAALDVAVLVVSAVEGIQGQTRALYRTLSAMGLPVIFFINKVDRIGSRLQQLLEELRGRFGRPTFLLNEVSGEGERSCTVTEYTRKAPTDEQVEALGDYSDEMAEAYLEGRSVSAAEFEKTLTQGVYGLSLSCVVAGAALQGKGVPSLLNLIDCLAQKPQGQDLPPLGYVYKAAHEDEMGVVAHVRMFQGTLKNRDAVAVGELEEPRKIIQIRALKGGKSVDAGSVTAGEIAAVYGLEGVRTGDVIGTGKLPRQPALSVPTMNVTVLPEKPEQLPALVKAVEKLTDEDPMLSAEYVQELRELRLHIAGMMQTELLGALLEERWGLHASFSSPRVIYKETVRTANRGWAEYTMPKPCWAVVGLWIEPLPRGSGVVLETTAEDRYIMHRYQNHVLQCLPGALKQGLFGWEVTDVKITLTDGQHHLIHTHPLDFFVCTPMALMDGLTRCGVKLLEPVMRMEMTGPEAALNRVLGELTAMRAALITTEREGEYFEIVADVPVATSMDWLATFSALTGGKGVLDMRFNGYQDAPDDVQDTLPRTGVDPRDRSKWILHCRNAL